MTTITDEEIAKLKAQPKTELEKIYENGIYAPGDRNARNLVPTMNYLESLPVEKALLETLALLFRRLTFFADSLPPEKREITLTKIIEFVWCDIKQNDKVRSTIDFKNLSRPHRTICNHFMNAFDDFKSARLLFELKLASDPIVVSASLFLSIEHIYKGDKRLIRESAKTQKEIALNASAVRQQPYAPAQKKTIELLKSLAPEKGWISKAQASKCVAPELENFLERECISTPNRITPGNVQRRIRNWLDNAPSVEKAFNENYFSTRK